jgi:hypothetical protein
MALAPDFRHEFRESLYRMIGALTQYRSLKDLNDGLGTWLRSTLAHLSIAAHFPFDAAGVAAWRSRRHAFLEDLIENATAIRFLVPRGE